jgi:CheY-like chemotaxis protein
VALKTGAPIADTAFVPSLRALVCDDYSMVRETIRPVLVDAGFDSIREATLATEAIAVAEMTQPDVVVLDLSLPGMSGLQAIPVIKVVSPRSTIIVFSAYDVWREAALQAGAYEYVDKSNVPRLQSVLERVAASTTPRAAR